MRFKASAIFFAAIILATVLLLYQLVSLPPDNISAESQQSYEVLQTRLKILEQDIAFNYQTIQEIRHFLKKFGSVDEKNVPVALNPKFLKPASVLVAEPSVSVRDAVPDTSISFNTSFAKIHSDDCTFSQSSPSVVDILMEEVYQSLPFDNPDGGAWKQGWDITYDRSQWSPEKPLKVFVVPHSHNDPGWIKTFEKYYLDQTSHILDSMARKLSEDPRRKFIWAEISYFSMWWERQTPTVQENVRKLLSRGQLEIVTGGWVMPDEAVTHYWALIDQLVTGHEWLRTHLNIKPNNGWSIDPFGMSATMAYVLKRAGLENMLIQRTHYAIKKHLAADRNLEFRWRQSWDPESSTDMLCHMMPFYSYDIPHTCGPDPKICCQFDFKRLPGSRVTCPWKVPPQPITPHNVQSRAEMLLDQYRKKAQLFRTNVLLVPLGDDFRYDTIEEWDNQYSNYQRLFDHMNAHSDYNVQAQFGTLSDYFHAVREDARLSLSQESGRVAAGTDDEESFFPTLAGDFFTYADRDDHYWSGYFTSRPYYKARSRMLASKLRAAEILYNLAISSGFSNSNAGWLPRSIAEQLHEKLSDAHKALGLFQHHDAITGTAKDHVVLDYANQLLAGIHLAEHVIQFTAHDLLAPEQENHSPDTVYLEVAERHEGASAVSVPRVLTLSTAGHGSVVVFNSHPHPLRKLITVRVDTYTVKVQDAAEIQLMCQVDPVFDGPLAGEVYDVTFVVELKPLSLAHFTIFKTSQVDRRLVHYSTIITRNEQPPILPPVFAVSDLRYDKALSMTCGKLTVSVGEQGLIETLTKDGVTSTLLLQFVAYYARKGREMAGAYLFLPSGPATVLSSPAPPTRTVTGPLMAVLTTKLPLVTHNLVLYNSPGIEAEAITIHNLVNVRSEKNFELAMRFVTDIQNQDVFYTDLNGFQMTRRVRYPKLTLQGNYYPIASQAFIEDSRNRLSILSAQPHGGGSLESGFLEVMQDRRLMQDDNRGLEQGVLDNVVTPNNFKILLETHLPDSDGAASGSGRVVYSSLLAEASLQELLFPPVVLLQSHKSSILKSEWSATGVSLGCDVQLVSLRSIRGTVGGGAAAGASAALTLRRAAYDCRFPPPKLDCVTNGGRVQLSDMLGAAYSDDVRQATLSLMYAGVNITKSFSLALQPMELYTFLLSPAPRPPLLAPAIS